MIYKTGNLYSLARDFSPSPGSLSISGGYDKLSQTSLNIVNDGNQDYITAYLKQGRDMVSINQSTARIALTKSYLLSTAKP